ncbi:hypothetical protein HJA86_31935 [Rhizobium bangladeshense]|nr:hypothetical protein [Rhizobium bangladeshense]
MAKPFPGVTRGAAVSAWLSIIAKNRENQTGLAEAAIHLTCPAVPVTGRYRRCRRATLKIRGFLETFPQEKYPDRTGYYMLTEAGLDAWQQHAAR